MNYLLVAFFVHSALISSISSKFMLPKWGTSNKAVDKRVMPNKFINQTCLSLLDEVIHDVKYNNYHVTFLLILF